MKHECKREFETRKIDDCTGHGWDICYGTNPMILELYFQDKNGLEDYCDEWIIIEVDYCPFCGKKNE